MKKIAFILGLSVMAINGHAQNIGNTSDLITIPGITDAVASALKQTKAVGLVDLNGNVGGGAYLPIRTLHDSSNVNYASVGIAGLTKQTDHWRALGTVLFDITSSFHRIEGLSSWYSSHVSKAALPDVWLGPDIQVPMPGDKVQFKDIRSLLGFTLAIGF
jgi:hypothetical protein